MGAAVAHPISPELVLVCPELRERALALLPAVDPDALFAVEPAPASTPRINEPPRLVLVEPVPPAPAPAPYPVEPARRAPLPVALAASRPRRSSSARSGRALTAVIAVVAFLLAR